jgi:hypothetical protein
MKRLGRILLSVAAVTSLVLFAATLALAVRSFRAMDRIWINVRPEHRTETFGLACLQSGKGGIGFWYNRISFADYPDPGRHARAVYAGWQHGASDPQYPNEWSGVHTGAFHFKDEARRPGNLPCFIGGIECSIPLWSVALITLPGTLLCARAVVRRLRRRRPGTCANCGYDLRATPDRCPECGTPT